MFKLFQERGLIEWDQGSDGDIAGGDGGTFTGVDKGGELSLGLANGAGLHGRSIYQRLSLYIPGAGFVYTMVRWLDSFDLAG